MEDKIFGGWVVLVLCYLYFQFNQQQLALPGYTLQDHHRTVCQLENGKIAAYNLCDKAASVPGFRYIGTGIIYSCDGVRQIGRDTFNFFIRTL